MADHLQVRLNAADEAGTLQERRKDSRREKRDRNKSTETWRGSEWKRNHYSNSRSHRPNQKFIASITFWLRIWCSVCLRGNRNCRSLSLMRCTELHHRKADFTLLHLWGPWHEIITVQREKHWPCCGAFPEEYSAGSAETKKTKTHLCLTICAIKGTGRGVQSYINLNGVSWWTSWNLVHGVLFPQPKEKHQV